MDPSPPKRRWFQISLKTLFVLTLVVAAYFAGLTTAQRRAERELQKAREEAEAERQASMHVAEQARLAELLARDQADLMAAAAAQQAVELQLKETRAAQALEQSRGAGK